MSGEGLLQAVNFVHYALEFGTVDEIEGALFAGKHIERQTPSSRSHGSGFLRRKAARCDGIQRQINQNPQAPHAPAFVVNFVLRRLARLQLFHTWPNTPKFN